jgi:hypothetical protein
MSKAQRIQEIIDYYGMSYNSFAISLGMLNGTSIKRIVDDNRNPQNQTLNKIVNTYPEIDMNWLRTGTGQMISNLPESISGNDDLTVTAKQVINQLDINNLHYTAILDKKMRDDRDYYDNDSNHVKNIASILEGFKSLEEKVEKYAVQASTEVVDNIIRISNNTETKFNAMAKDMDINNTRRADEVSKVIAEKMNESNQYWIKRAEKKDAYWLKENNQQKDLFLKTLEKVLHIEQDLEDIKTFMAANFELDKMNKKKSTQIKKLTKRIKQ